jgi:hypothetical protein
MAKALSESVALFGAHRSRQKKPAARAKIETSNRLTAIETFVLWMSNRAHVQRLMPWLADAAALALMMNGALTTPNYQHRNLSAPHDFVSHTADQQTV